MLCPEYFPAAFTRLVTQIVDDLAVALPVIHPRMAVEVREHQERAIVTFTTRFDFVRRAAFGIGQKLLTGEVEQLRRELAARLQDVFVEEFRQYLPPCPGHEHPLVAEIRDLAVWECPYDAGHWSCRIGTYPESRQL